MRFSILLPASASRLPGFPRVARKAGPATVRSGELPGPRRERTEWRLGLRRRAPEEGSPWRPGPCSQGSRLRKQALAPEEDPGRRCPGRPAPLPLWSC